MMAIAVRCTKYFLPMIAYILPFYLLLAPNSFIAATMAEAEPILLYCFYNIATKNSGNFFSLHNLTPHINLGSSLVN